MSDIVELLDAVLEFFGPKGRRWTRHKFEDGAARCLRGALREQRARLGVGYDYTEEYLFAALPVKPFKLVPGRPHGSYRKNLSYKKLVHFYLMQFNDSCRGFSQVRALLLKARLLAEQDAAKRRALEALSADMARPTVPEPERQAA
jgi:hypothetical protein